MRTFGLACLLSLLLPISGCGNVFVHGMWNGKAQSVNGLVSMVQLTIVSDGNNVSTQVTVVTFVTNPGSTTVSFCGDQRSQFPVNNLAQATFTPGQPCSSLLTVVIRIG